mgnify:CR=1 FL=1
MSRPAALVAALEAMGRRIIAQVERPVEIAGEICRVSASLGVAISSRYAGVDWDRMEAEADAALAAIDAAEKSGRDVNEAIMEAARG